MSYFGNFSTHKVVEMNQSTGLRIGHMVAQTPFVKGAQELDSLDNGYILALDTAKDELKLAAGTESRLFIHFTEEHMPIMNAGLKYFTVPFIGEGATAYCYPRAIALHENDAWTTNNYAGTFPEDTEVAKAKVVNGVFTIDGTPATITEGDHVFLAKKATLPDGTTPAVQFIYVGKEVA